MNYIKTVIIVLFVGGFIWFINDYQKTKQERRRFESNQLELINGLKDGLISLELNDAEFEDYIKNADGQLSGINKQLEENGIKLNRVNKIISTSINAVDSSQTKILLTSLEDLKRAILRVDNDSIEVEIPFSDKTECFEFSAKLTLDNDSTYVTVLSRKFTDTINHVGYWERRQWKFLGLIPTRVFGKKIAKLEVFNNCGFSKTIVLEKK